MDPQAWRPSAAIGAMGMAVFVTAVVGITDSANGTIHPATFYAYLFSAIFGFVMATAHLGAGMIRGLLFAGNGWAELRDRFQPAVPEVVEPIEAGKDSGYDPEREAWRLALDRFFRAGDQAGGFSAGKLSGVAGSDAWPKLVHFYASEQGGNVLRDAGGNVGHQWGHGWTLDRVMLALGNDRLPRPDMPLPVIQPYVAVAAQRSRARKSAEVVKPDKVPSSQAMIDNN